jgi:heme a synthase
MYCSALVSMSSQGPIHIRVSDDGPNETMPQVRGPSSESHQGCDIVEVDKRIVLLCIELLDLPSTGKAAKEAGDWCGFHQSLPADALGPELIDDGGHGGAVGASRSPCVYATWHRAGSCRLMMEGVIGSMTVGWQPPITPGTPAGVLSEASPSAEAAAGRHNSPSAARAVGVWLWCLAALVFAMVLVGGATRLTESGLSIVEWKPVTGVFPPFSEADWQAEFAKYKTIPQYQQLNQGMSLDAFKAIYWWEWSHRLLGRVIGAAFLLPFLWFLWRRAFDRRTGLALGGIFALGAVQGGVGWWMVASGLTEGIRVSHYRLAFHLTLACMIYVALVWAADRLLHAPALHAPPEAGEGRGASRRLRWSAAALLVLVVAQIYLGALVAGLHAGLVYNTWPLINGSFIPAAADLLFNQPLWRNLFENHLTVQFEHRMMAYTLFALALFHALDARRFGPGMLATGAGFVAVAVLVQAGLGIMTLLFSVPIELALAHQAMALVVLTAATLHAARTFRANTT